MNLELIPAVDAAPIPGPEWLFQVLLVFTFFLHLLFLNLTLGGTLLAAVAHLTAGGRLDDPRTVLARRLVGINTYAISLTITTGVAPLLFIQVLYQQYFYTATILIAGVWFTLLLLLMAGYYAVYAYKFGPSVGGRERRGPWIAFSAVMFLAIAMIHVAVNLIHSQPETWAALATAPWAILGDPTYVARLLHFVFAAVGVSALVCVWWAGRQAGRGIEQELNGRIVAYAWRWVLATTVLQVVDGFVLLFLLPSPVLTGLMQSGLLARVTLIAGVVVALGVLVMVTRVHKPEASPGLVGGVLAAMVVAVAVMAVLRHSVRALYLEPFTRSFELTSAPQWGNFALFAVLLLAGVASIAYFVRRVLSSPATGADAA